MPQVNFYLDEEENKIVEECSKKWNLTNKSETLKKIIKEFKILNGDS